MVNITSDNNLSLDNIIELYTSGEKELYTDYERLYENILKSDYLITIRDDGELIGLIRSSGDGNNNQFISELILHGSYPTHGLGSKLLDAYLKKTENISKIYILSHEHYRTSFSKTWLLYKGFKIIADNETIIVYLLDRNIKY